MQRFLNLLFLFFLFHFQVAAQSRPENLINARTDTLRLNMAQVEELFVKNNLPLLLQRLDIGAAQAAIVFLSYLSLNTFIDKPEDSGKGILPHYF